MVELLRFVVGVQEYVPPAGVPEPFNTTEFPAQTETSAPALTTGAGCMVITVGVDAAVQPACDTTFSVIVYVPGGYVIVGGVCEVEEEGLPPGKDQE